ncbi:hypothetical protein ASF11_06390 [Acidovorax sp. Leaf76]|uniref:hypothetical protein n=1 Tax=unclassified Acidovorax TaxID=2684926 RepID=UPI0006FF08CE|nr:MULTISPECIES: hypothetical protein [unclassified Acidovorax]KQO22027.1 hypothetical protein ASF11_06390 [Acidovorax sp. Leaf76]KQO35097.1 hypothetical protein ASF19_05265 [Acidovorax sp. Leaf84]KQS34881.1 hypothetical protein ASG27_05505 [Acidovorax sp. Leaf191]
MPLAITSQPAGTRFSITDDATMPTVTVTAVMQGQPMPSGPAPTYEWSATLAFDGSAPPTNVAFGGGRSSQHSRIAPQTGLSPTWRIPFTEVRGGLLTVQVIMRVGTTEQRARASWTVVGTNPTGTAIRAFANSIGANRPVFRKKMRQESSLQQFRTPSNWPKYSSDGLGGVGLCQLTRPAPTADQTWNWKDNVRGGWALYQEKERIAKSYPRNVRTGERFRNLVTAWNRARTAQGLPALPVELPDYTPEQLELDTLRGFNGYANGLHEYRVRQDNGVLFVTVDGSGTRGFAEWERVPVADRGTVGDPNYVENVLAQSDF